MKIESKFDTNLSIMRELLELSETNISEERRLSLILSISKKLEILNKGYVDDNLMLTNELEKLSKKLEDLTKDYHELNKKYRELYNEQFL